MRDTDPVLQRRRLRDRLRKLRESCDFTQKAVAEAMDWSPSKVIRIESGNVGISVTDLRILLQHYGVTDRLVVDELVAIARAAKMRPWWEKYKNNLSPAFLAYLSYEGHASILRHFSPFRVPGLLQTEEYMYEVFESNRVADRSGRISESDISLRAELRIERQERLLGGGGPELNFILDESVIRRPVNSRSVMRGQLQHLLEMAQEPKITLRVLPLSVGMYPKCFNPYSVLEFESSEQDLVVYLEDVNVKTIREGYTGDAPDGYSPSDYLEVFFGLEQVAPATGTRDLLEQAMEDFT
ncbi:helix-turn-helix domain-containing protein [Streptomyces violascens]|uniref:helix-turn-helix domain-containing protein n=1 Tax=Streptomyces violascens TaxID=67381 RepID=UPI0036AACAB6